METTLNYSNLNLLKYHSEKYNLPLDECRYIFSEFKTFMWIVSKGHVDFVPALEIDKMWHSFLLFTKDYKAFCDQLGVFVHHSPANIRQENTGTISNRKILTKYFPGREFKFLIADKLGCGVEGPVETPESPVERPQLS